MQIEQLEDRVRRDAEKIEFLGQNIAQYKVRLAWTQVIAWARRTKNPMVDAETQDGQGLPEAEGLVRRPSTYRPATVMSNGTVIAGPITDKKKAVTKEMFAGQVVAYSAFWGGVV